MSGDSTAVGLSALDGAAPTLSVTIASGKGGDLFVVEKDGLGVVAG